MRLDRAAAAKAIRFSGLGGRVEGRRAVAGWDEDPVTMAVEAARGFPDTDRLVFGSTSAPFHERLQATLVAAALGLPESLRTQDVSGSRRCAVSALLEALLGAGKATVVAAEKRPVRAGAPAHLAWGDGAAAAAVGDAGGARLIGFASRNHDLLDVFSSREAPTPYMAEERFVREVAAELIGDTIAAACADAGLDAARIAQAAVHEPLPGMWRDVAKRVGIAAPNHAADVQAQAGDLGAAHSLFAFSLALAAAKPGEVVLLAGFGSGVDALLFEVVGPVAGTEQAATALRQGAATPDYVRVLSLTGALDLDFGARSEFEQKAQPTVVERHGRDAMGFVGGRDAAGAVQFPKSRVPVRPGASGPEPMSDVRLADEEATLVSVTADRLNYTPDPPFWFGLVQFDNGARVLMELTDASGDGFKVGDRLRMRARIKSHDRRRGLRTYFWKAAPLERPALET